MKKQLPLLVLFAFYVLLQTAARALPVNVQKQPGSNELVGNLVVPNGVTISATGTGQINATSLSGTYTGQTSITTLGTIVTGTWNGTLLAGQYGGTGVNNNGKTITLGGNFITSGAFAATLTFSATTNATFPSGTHTLAPTDTPVFTTNITAPKVIWTGSVNDTAGTGSPESVVTSPVGSVFRRTDGSAGLTLYVKETGSGNTGWVAHAPGTGTIGGSTGSTSGAIITANGTGGSTIQAPSSVATIDGSGNIAANGLTLVVGNTLPFTSLVATNNGSSFFNAALSTYGAAAGTGPSSTIGGVSNGGKVSVTTGTGCSTGTLIGVVLPAYAYTKPVSITLTPANANAAGIMGTIWVSSSVVTPSVKTFQIEVATSAPADSTTYDFWWTAIAYP